jgi:hypothetical protein
VEFIAREKLMLAKFPNFSNITLEDRRMYERLMSGYPPYASLCFSKLMLFWDQLDNLAMSDLNGNLVISYWWPGSEENSGLSLIGRERLDESFCTIFDHIREQNDEPRLVHVPEFVVTKLKYPELFGFRDERDFDEYVVPLKSLYPLSNVLPLKRKKVEKFKRRGYQLEVKSLDLNKTENVVKLLYCAQEWHQKGNVNHTVDPVQEVIRYAITRATPLGINNICLFMDGELGGFLLYSKPEDSRYIIANFIKVNPTIPDLFDFMEFTWAKWMSARGVSYANLDCDLGLPQMRRIRLRLGPVNFFRKYTVEPR